MDDGRTFDFEPHNEMGVVFLFGRFYDVLGFEGIVHIGTRCPDCIAVRKGKTLRVEFEHRSSNFLNHRHELTQADVLVCWTADMDLAIETIESADFLSEEQRRDIFCRNAARFLRLDLTSCNSQLEKKP